MTHDLAVPLSPTENDILAAEWRRPAPEHERRAAGRRLRERIPFSSIATLVERSDRRPSGILDEQDASRLQDLVPLRKERMAQSPFAFYRGTAALMAADLCASPHTAILVPSCGDAHVANFGFYASPQRTLVFDLNDFDEAAWSPWEWDLKRLEASVVIGGQASSRDTAVIERAVRTSVRLYASTLRTASEAPPTQRFFAHLDAEAGVSALDRSIRKVVNRAIAQARKRTGERAVRKLTTKDPSGRLVFVPSPPTMLPVAEEVVQRLREYMRGYLETANPDIRQLVQNYVVSDVIRRVVGVGSVGTRCALTLLQDGDDNTLLLQSKEAGRSVLEQYGGIAQPRILTASVEQYGQGARVVALQRILQAVSDPFLGYLRAEDFDLYVRQFHDMKGGIDVEEVDDTTFVGYAQACAIVLARAHSQSPATPVISGYLGKGRAFSEAVLEWSYAYAELSLRDYETFRASLLA